MRVMQLYCRLRRRLKCVVWSSNEPASKGSGFKFFSGLPRYYISHVKRKKKVCEDHALQTSQVEHCLNCYFLHLIFRSSVFRRHGPVIAKPSISCTIVAGVWGIRSGNGLLCSREPTRHAFQCEQLSVNPFLQFMGSKPFVNSTGEGIRVKERVTLPSYSSVSILSQEETGLSLRFI